jgi:hypothetical protein
VGFNYQRIGYATVQNMFNALQADERNHVLALFDYIRTDAALLQALHNADYVRFARGYNGPGQAQYYGDLIETWVNGFTILRTAPATAVFDVAAAPAPALREEIDTLLAYLPMPMPADVFIQVEPPPVAADSEPAPEPMALPALQPTTPFVDEAMRRLWLKHVEYGFETNKIMFNRVLRGFMVPYYMTIVMYCILFAAGIGLFVIAARLSAERETQVGAIVFGGLGVASFVGYFLSRPLRALEENLQFITWLGIVYNTYWTRLLYMQDSKTVQADLKEATSEAVQQIEHLLNKNVEVAGKRPNVKEE